ncbi:tellurite resistance TerB family protein [uncultured Bartonella sp.]|uniref:tellurite resistance TerB family protein n=1 Tax=uncultured Bartonella sp. TaxID=104108 RepID=UPI00260B9873|nr:tellurite resistance TerB family protein [uncultured Bartonella sp.]
MEKLTVQEALIYIMVTTSAADEAISDNEFKALSEIVSHFPVFRGFDIERLDALAAECCVYLENPDGIERILDVTEAALPAKLRETAYALAVEIAASDLDIRQEELMFLQLLRDRFELEDLTVAAIERSARIRFRKA